MIIIRIPAEIQGQAESRILEKEIRRECKVRRVRRGRQRKGKNDSRNEKDVTKC